MPRPSASNATLLLVYFVSRPAFECGRAATSANARFQRSFNAVDANRCERCTGRDAHTCSRFSARKLVAQGNYAPTVRGALRVPDCWLHLGSSRFCGLAASRITSSVICYGIESWIGLPKKITFWDRRDFRPRKLVPRQGSRKWKMRLSGVLSRGGYDQAIRGRQA